MLHPTPFRAAAREVFLTHVLSSFITVVIVISCYANNCYVAINNLAMPLVFTTCREYQIGLAIDPRIKFVTRPFLAGIKAHVFCTRLVCPVDACSNPVNWNKSIVPRLS